MSRKKRRNLTPEEIAEREKEDLRGKRFDAACEGSPLDGETDLTVDDLCERDIKFGFCRYHRSLEIVNRLLNERGLEISITDDDFGSDMAFIIQEKQS